jgi:hypothetical protein
MMYTTTVHPKLMNTPFSKFLLSVTITRKYSSKNVMKCFAYILLSNTYVNLHPNVSFVKLQNINKYNANSGINKFDTSSRDSNPIRCVYYYFI